MSILLKYGRWSGYIRPKLRAWFEKQGNKNKLVNDLLEAEYERQEGK